MNNKKIKIKPKYNKIPFRIIIYEILIHCVVSNTPSYKDTIQPDNSQSLNEYVRVYNAEHDKFIYFGYFKLDKSRESWSIFLSVKYTETLALKRFAIPKNIHYLVIPQANYLLRNEVYKLRNILVKEENFPNLETLAIFEGVYIGNWKIKKKNLLKTLIIGNYWDGISEHGVESFLKNNEFPKLQSLDLHPTLLVSLKGFQLSEENCLTSIFINNCREVTDDFFTNNKFPKLRKLTLSGLPEIKLKSFNLEKYNCLNEITLFRCKNILDNFFNNNEFPKLKCLSLKALPCVTLRHFHLKENKCLSLISFEICINISNVFFTRNQFPMLEKLNLVWLHSVTLKGLKLIDNNILSDINIDTCAMVTDDFFKNNKFTKLKCVELIGLPLIVNSTGLGNLKGVVKIGLW